MKLIAHRGFSAKLPDNTVAAFTAALERATEDRRVFGIELDIQFTKDEQIVVFHDTLIGDESCRTAVSEVTYDELVENQVDNIDGERVPLFQEILELVDHQLELLVEIKAASYDKANFVRKLQNLLKAYQPQDDVILHSFSAEMMAEVIATTAGDKVLYGFLCSSQEAVAALGTQLKSSLHFFHPQYKFFLADPNLFLELGKPVHVWTVNSEAVLREIVACKANSHVRGVITDDLDIQ